MTIAATAVELPRPLQAGHVQAPAIAGWLSVVLSAGVIAAAITGSINVWLAHRKDRLDDRARRRAILAEAYQAYADYKEMPYAIRRRDADKPAEERLRLSEALRAIQSRLTYFDSWIQLEAPDVAAAYSTLITQLRIIAGGAMRTAWESAGLSDDPGMNIAPTVIDLSQLAPFEQAYRDAVATHLRPDPKWRNRRRPVA